MATQKYWVIPSLRYRHANAAIDWLCKAFRFSRQLVAANEQGGVVHAQLALPSGAMIMLGSCAEPVAANDNYSKAMALPERVMD